MYHDLPWISYLLNRKRGAKCLTRFSSCPHQMAFRDISRSATRYVHSPPTPSPPGDRRGAENSRSLSTDDRLKTLRAYRRARGLCFTCGEKWSPNHACSSTV